MALEESQAAEVLRELEANGGNQRAAARALRIHRNTIGYRLGSDPGFRAEFERVTGRTVSRSPRRW